MQGLAFARGLDGRAGLRARSDRPAGAAAAWRRRARSRPGSTPIAARCSPRCTPARARTTAGAAASAAPPAATLDAWTDGARRLAAGLLRRRRRRPLSRRDRGRRSATAPTCRRAAPALAAEAGRIAAVHPERAVAPARRSSRSTSGARTPSWHASAAQRAEPARTDVMTRLRAVTTTSSIERLTRRGRSRPGRRAWKRAASPIRGPARCSRGSWRNRDVTRVFVLRLPGGRGRRLLLVLVPRRRAAHQHAGRRLPLPPAGTGRLADALTSWRTPPGRGGAGATLEVRESNQAARRLYEGLGFTVTAKRPKYYTQPEEDALILWHEDLTNLDHPPC